MTTWPASADELVDAQLTLALANPPPWHFDDDAVIGGCFVCSSRAKRGHGAAGDPLCAALEQRPDVLLVDATGLDHPRGAGLALHLGAVLDLPTVGVTHRPLLADGDWPEDAHGARSPLVLDAAVVGFWLRTRPGTRPLAVHAAWRTEPETAVEVVAGALAGHRAPEPLRRVRRAAREARRR